MEFYEPTETNVIYTVRHAMTQKNQNTLSANFGPALNAQGRPDSFV